MRVRVDGRDEKVANNSSPYPFPPRQLCEEGNDDAVQTSYALCDGSLLSHEFNDG